jgi:hypothetical protein
MLKSAELTGGSRTRTAGGTFDGAQTTLPPGITKKQSHFYQEITGAFHG